MSGNNKGLNFSISATTGGLTKGLRKAQNQVSSFSKSVNKATGGYGKGFGLVLGATAAAAAVSSAVRSIADFERSISEVEAISGATGPTLEKLKENALELGRTTKFTAVEVAGLSKELSKLGFTANETLAASQAILDLAAATGSDLSEAAEIAGITLRSFNFDASEMTRVVDVMTKSFSSSALDMNKFRESMSYVAPVASQAGVSLETTTAMLAKLADVGISGSMAGTSLRRIFLEMAKTGLPAAKAFEVISSKGSTLTGAMDAVGLRAVTALSALNRMKSGVYDLAEEFENANGNAREMATVFEDNLTGDITRLGSAYDGLIQKGGSLNTVFRSNVQYLIDLVDAISGNDGAEKSLWELIPAINAISGLWESAFGDPEPIKVAKKEIDRAIESMDLLGISFQGTGKFVQATSDQLSKLSEQEAIATEARIKRIEAEEKQKQKNIKALAENIRLTKIMLAQEKANAEFKAKNIDLAKQMFSENEKALLQLVEKIDLMSEEALMKQAESEGVQEDGSEGEKKAAELKQGWADDEIKSNEQRAKAATNAAMQIGTAMGLERDERKKAIADILKANAAMIISDLISSAVAKIPFPLNIAAGLAAGVAGGMLVSKIPALAEGGIATRPTLAMIGEGRESEAILPLSKLDKMMRGGGGGGTTVNIHGFVGDEIAVGKAVKDAITRHDELVG